MQLSNKFCGIIYNVPGYQNIPTLCCHKVSCFVFNYWIQIEFLYNWICILWHAIYITGCYPLIWLTKHFRYCFIYVATNSFNTFVLIKHPLNLIRLPHIHWLNSNHCFWWTLYLLQFHKHDVLFVECCSTETNITISRSELHTRWPWHIYWPWQQCIWVNWETLYKNQWMHGLLRGLDIDIPRTAAFFDSYFVLE